MAELPTYVGGERRVKLTCFEAELWTELCLFSLETLGTNAVILALLKPSIPTFIPINWVFISMPLDDNCLAFWAKLVIYFFICLFIYLFPPSCHWKRNGGMLNLGC